MQGLESFLQSLTDAIGNTIRNGNPAVFFMMYFGGILSSLLPCTYPLLPVTVAYIGGSARSKLNGFILSLFYFFGMVFVIVLIGSLVFFTKVQLFNYIGASPWTYIILGNILIILALAMFEVFVIRTPQFLHKLKPHGKKKGIIPAFLVGASGTAILSPCVAPPFFAILALIFSSKIGYFYSLGLITSYALGLCTLFLIVGTFAGVATKLPKAGKWMHVVRIIFAVVLILSAEYFFVKAGNLWSEGAAVTQTIPAQLTLPGTEAPNPAFALPADARVGTDVGNYAPDFTINDVTGNPVTLRSFAGKKAVLLVFSGAYCVACKDEVPRLNELYAKYKETGKFIVINVSVDPSVAKALSTAVSWGITYPVVVDSERKVFTLLHAPGTPTDILISPKQKILFKQAYPPAEEDIEQAIADVADE